MFQCNTIYVLSEDDLRLYFKEQYFIGKLTDKDFKKIKDMVEKSYDDVVNITQYFSNYHLK